MTAAEDLQLVDLVAGDPRWTQTLPVLRELRPHLSAELLGVVLAHDTAPTFSALLDRDGSCRAVAGWRVMTTTANPSGHRLHVDDLVTTAAHRGKGYGVRLLDLLEERAAAAGCALIELDSGVQRTAAHDFYRARGMTQTCHHFGKPIGTGG